MQLCSDHWATLRKAIDERGLRRFVAKDGNTAVNRIRRELEGTAGPDDYDPLMAANNAIWSNAINVGGLAVMAPDAGCPLCFLNQAHKESCTEEGCEFSYDGWIERAANEVDDYVKKKLPCPWQ